MKKIVSLDTKRSKEIMIKQVKILSQGAAVKEISEKGTLIS